MFPSLCWRHSYVRCILIESEVCVLCTALCWFHTNLYPVREWFSFKHMCILYRESQTKLLRLNCTWLQSRLPTILILASVGYNYKHLMRLKLMWKLICHKFRSSKSPNKRTMCGKQYLVIMVTCNVKIFIKIHMNYTLLVYSYTFTEKPLWCNSLKFWNRMGQTSLNPLSAMDTQLIRPVTLSPIYLIEF